MKSSHSQDPRHRASIKIIIFVMAFGLLVFLQTLPLSEGHCYLMPHACSISALLNLFLSILIRGLN
ncbi:hypothetical protein F5Y19DRAFT_131351 [Xylariaceae sp. FL1651]|nr:hypothetical protein F5Y19DRAFT_131351 [Xylariaceae sp. FL1651]